MNGSSYRWVVLYVYTCEENSFSVMFGDCRSFVQQKNCFLNEREQGTSDTSWEKWG